MLALGVALAAARAEEKPAAPAAGGEASISSAKKDFDTIKAAREAALQAKSEGLNIATPAMETDPAATPGAWLRAQQEKEKELAAKKKKSANWLLEAMEQERKPGAEPARASELEQMRALMSGERSTETTTAALASTTTAADDKAKDKAAPPTVVNPLTRYMSDWMTPKDFALLRSTPGVASANEGGVAGVGAATLPDAIATGSVANGLPGANANGGLDAALGFGAGRMPSIATPRENPFLPALQSTIPSANSAPAAFTPPTTLAPLPPLSGGPASPTNGFQPAPLPEIAPARTTVPDFARPAIDDKAFKPMKRF